MVGLIGQALGWDKAQGMGGGLYSAWDKNRNAIGSLAQSVVGQPDTVGVLQALAGGAMPGRQIDMAEKDRQAALEKDKKAVNATVTFLQSNNPELASLVEAGALEPAQAYQMHVSQSQGMEPTANMRDFQFSQQNPGFQQFINPGSNAKPTAGIQEYEYAKSQGFPGTFNDFQKQSRPAPAMNATIQKEIFETDEGIQAGQSVVQSLGRALQLNDIAYDGPFAEQRSYATALMGDESGKATQELKNVVTSQALDSLKAVFGGMPTEGERKILLEIQGSVDQPKPVREAIYRRAQAAAERRIRINQQKAGALRTGMYFGEEYDPSANAPAGNRTSSGLSWSVEP